MVRQVRGIHNIYSFLNHFNAFISAHHFSVNEKQCASPVYSLWKRGVYALFLTTKK